MAADSNSAFHRHQQQSSEMISMVNYYKTPGTIFNLGVNNRGAVAFGDNSTFPSNFGGSTVVLDSVPGLKHNTGFSVAWTVDDQRIMDEGLAKFANEPAIMRYIKIASSLQDKTVRDVALRWRWMTRNRKIQEDHHLGMKVKDWKEILAESSLKNSMSTSPLKSDAAFSLTSNHFVHSLFSEVCSSTSQHLLEENHRMFGQISVNLLTHQLQENIDLFIRARNNITSVLNDMRNMPGIISRMPPLPVLINEELASRIFPRMSQV